MRILIDLQSMQTESRFRGIGHYSIALIKEVIRINKEHEIIILINDYGLEYEVKSDLGDLITGVTIKVFSALDNTSEVIKENISSILISEKIRECFINSLNPDFVLITSLFEGAGERFVCSIPSNRAYKVGVIGYDLIPLSNEKMYLGDENIKNWYYRKLDSLDKSDFIYSISESAKKEFEKYTAFKGDNIINISSACEDYYSVLESSELDITLPDKFGISKKFVLYSGALDERKNVLSLVQAFSKLENTIQADFQLLLVGKYTEEDKESLKHAALDLGMDIDVIKYTGFISEHELVMLYNLCHCFVFPSLHEGFGLPLLEAMSCGAPSISSNTSSLPEVIHDEDAMFAPTDVDEIKTKLQLLLCDESYRNSRKKNGLQQADKFSWNKSASVLLKHIESICEVNLDSSYEAEYKRVIRELSNYINKYSLSDDVVRRVSKCLAHNEVVLSNVIPKVKFSWRVEGPFDSSYSLALLNRETARALKAIGQSVVLYSTEGPGDFDPSLEFLESNPDIKELYLESLKDSPSYDVQSRNLYPPRVTGMQGKCNLLHHYAWEESGFPQEWVNEFNTHLSGLTCLSSHVKKIMIDNGVALPLYTSGCGVDHWNRVKSSSIPYPIEAKKFRFLNVSSCFPRKGVDVLLEAYGRSFTCDDDVSLIIKTFDNPHNEVSAQLEQCQRENNKFPHVVIIKQDLKDTELKSIYEQCDVLVSPSKAEGFGLPMAEAILSGLPVITTAWGGQRDFCDSDNSWLIDYEFELADTHFELFDSVWACPKASDLSLKLREVYYTQPEERRNKVEAAQKRLASEFSWEQVVINLVNQTEKIINNVNKKKYNIGWVSSWNQKCGIAKYSEHLVEQNRIDNIYIFAPKFDQKNSFDAQNVQRCWLQNDKDDLNELYEQIIDSELDIVVIQMNYYFFDYNALSELIVKLKKQEIVVILTLHSTKDPEESKRLIHLLPALQYIDRIMVHTVGDLNRLKSIGLVDNVLLFPHGILEKEPSEVNLDIENTHYIASYGFALPHKGIEQLIDAFCEISKSRHNTKLLLMNAEHPDPTSKAFIDTIRTKIDRLGLSDRVILNTEFLPDSLSLGYLSKADVIVMPYQHTGESSSAAVRTAISSGSPVLVTPLSIFDDVEGAVGKLDGCKPEDIAKSINHILDKPESYDYQSMVRWKESHSYGIVSDKLFNILRSLYINRN